ncbi:MAG TPA: TIGR01212 family radical SAM protein [Candidatus Egerieimonas intestinavium]|uniref:TIGR01212 family radical SAM protein n=1 Tax=Candidatus Egerieimonas intestinavium TaxID=2840777 RepID=A0A9D1JGY9_9FIRM|nr:TIGR01212 family radical SAM protein [Candidatus Egerieimonas intestinavium]
MAEEKPYYSLDRMLRERFHEKVYKLSLDAGCSCPNRDGTRGTGGCIFCSAGGSGDFAGDRRLSIPEQLEAQKALVCRKRPVRKFIAYFQAYSNTYAPLDHLRQVYGQALKDSQVAALSIATRPDCLPPEVLDLLSECNRVKPVWVELGLQTIHEDTARYIRRGYPYSCFLEAVEQLHRRDLEIIVHTILGLPGESREDMLATMEALNPLPIQGVKLQLLHVLKGTELASDYEAGKFQVLDRETYLNLVIDCLERLRPDLVIHRVTGDGPRDLLVAPLWSCAKRSVLNDLHRLMRERGARQGRLY